jgi:hypothetical protein
MSRQADADAEFLEAELERAIAPYRSLLAADVLVELRSTLALALATHPVGSAVVRRARPTGTVQQSGAIERVPSRASLAAARAAGRGR